MKKRVFFVLAFFLWATGVGVAAGPVKARKKVPARVKPLVVTLLPIDRTGVSEDVVASLEKVALQELEEMGVFKLVPERKAKAIFELLKKRKVLVPGCVERKKCARIAGQRTGARVVFHLGAVQIPDGVSLTMRTMDVRSGKELRKVTELASTDPAELDLSTRWLVRKVSSPMISTLYKGMGKGKLEIECQQADADLMLNGKSFGKRTNKGFKVSAGVFDVVVKKTGYVEFHDVVVVKPGEERKVVAALKAEGEPAAVIPPPVVATTEPPPAASEATPSGQGGKELPPWAVFEKPPEPAPTAVPPPITRTEKPEAKPPPKTQVATTSAPEARAPFLPPPKPEPVEVAAESVSERRFYQTWWFWTLVGVGVAGAGGATAYFLLGKESGGGAGLGSATLSWE